MKRTGITEGGGTALADPEISHKESPNLYATACPLLRSYPFLAACRNPGGRYPLLLDTGRGRAPVQVSLQEGPAPGAEPVLHLYHNHHQFRLCRPHRSHKPILRPASGRIALSCPPSFMAVCPGRTPFA